MSRLIENVSKYKYLLFLLLLGLVLLLWPTGGGGVQEQAGRTEP